MFTSYPWNQDSSKLTASVQMQGYDTCRTSAALFLHECHVCTAIMKLMHLSGFYLPLFQRHSRRNTFMKSLYLLDFSDSSVFIYT